MNETDSIDKPQTKPRPWWQRIPLTLQIVIALILAVALGVALGAGNPSEANKTFIETLAIPAELVLKALRALATPLILMAVLHTFMTTHIPGRAGRRLAVLLFTNTTVAIVIGLLVANVMRPGTWGNLASPIGEQTAPKSFDPWGLLKDAVPKAVLEPLVNNNVIQLIVIALCFGIVLRAIKSEQVAQGQTTYQPIEQVIGVLFEAIIRILHWVIALVPLAVFGIVAKVVAEKGFEPFKSLGAFVVAVVVALALQACYYLTRVKFGSWVKPQNFLRGGTDAFLTAFSTDSSVATMPVTFEALQHKIGVRETSASLGALVGANFNNDGTALYEAMSALFISQVLGQNLNLGQQFVVILTSIFASVGAAGIPEAGLVTMTLVFTSVGLPTQYIALLITVDWFLDRCRTVINVMGDMTVSALLDGKKPRSVDEA
ncbi:dicarboxylate/amino acid:cation symporter [Mastigocladopsis repens]|uniref:dicarboxylate/amino acid:cation symporter n=1 Tax=Mastigocladopsis repens TaxID=221287 RepID=UPI000304D398|nr:dicarboxylate/amino acid:cation symporter [Mastigocladopsis repens]